MTQVVSDDVGALRNSMSGKVLLAGDGDYDDARRVWNAAIDRRPAVIAQCTSADDVAAAVTFAVQHQLEISVRGGAHGVSGKAVVDDGMMIDLSQMNSVTVDAQARRATVGGGALLADVIATAQEHGLATTVGMVGHTGVGGLTLGGGMGWLSRKHGLSIDNVVSAQVVTADGKTLRASEQDNPDLFWAIRGGGGNFGVVTEFEFALHPVGPIVQMALLFWDVDQGKDFFRLVDDLCSSLPPEISVVFGGLNAPPAPFVPEEHHMKPGYVLIITGFGAAEEHEAVVNQVRTTLPPLFEFVTPMPYLALQTMLDEANAWGQYDYDKGGFLTELSDETIDTITEHFPRKQSPGSVVLFYRLDNAYAAVPDEATAFSGERVPGYGVFIIAVCPNAELLDADRTWVRELYAAIQPHMRTRAYINGIDEDEADMRTTWGPEKYDRLSQIKGKYDPSNVFHRNANIKPIPAPPAQRTGS
jgi:hypothetical protein